MESLYKTQIELWKQRRLQIHADYWQGKMTMEEVARKWKITRQRVEQILKKVKKERDAERVG